MIRLNEATDAFVADRLDVFSGTCDLTGAGAEPIYMLQIGRAGVQLNVIMSDGQRESLVEALTRKVGGE